MPMTPVKDCPKFCVLACLSSILHDQNRRKTILQIVCERPMECNVGLPDEGIVETSKLVQFFGLFGVPVTILPNGYLLQPSDGDGSLLAGLEWQEQGKTIRHMVRIDQIDLPAGNFSIMDPHDHGHYPIVWHRIKCYLGGKAVTYFRHHHVK